MALKMAEWETPTEVFMVNFPDLVGKEKVWMLPMRLMKLSLKDFAITIKTKYNANLTFYKGEDGHFSWLGYSFNTLEDCRKYKNYINRLAREQGLEKTNYKKFIGGR